MTPTLQGRWQTRLLLLLTIGFAISLIFSFFLPSFFTPFILVMYVLILGFGWDILYNFLQTFRWDRDWPPAFQLAAGIFEALVIWLIFRLSGLPGVDPNLDIITFVAHYSAVWITTFLASQGLLRIIFPRWRFRGGEWLSSQ